MIQQMESNLFVGLDMVDGCKPSPRRVDLAFLDRSLICAFELWDFNARGRGLFPGELAPPGFALAIDGPQGLAGSPEAGMRKCEREGGIPGKSPYELPSMDKPYAGFVISSIQLFTVLWESGRFHLHGFPMAAKEAALIEVYPGKGWVDLAKPLHMPLTVKKQRLEGRRQRQRILEAAGVSLPTGRLPSHDQLDAALAALIAFRFTEGTTTQQGAPPVWDAEKQVLREGFIIYP